MDYRENRIFFGKNIPINSTNPYKGSAFDDVKSFSFNPFAASVNDHSKYEDYVGLIAGLPYVNVGDTNLEVDIPLSLYNNYKFDPRENYMVLGNSISGQKNITFLFHILSTRPKKLPKNMGLYVRLISLDIIVNSNYNIEEELGN